MTAFDHLVPGTPEQAWQTSPLLAQLRALAAPAARDRVLVLAAHPDDETLGAGGLIAACAQASVEVVVVVASDGEASHPRSPTTTPQLLATRRRSEVKAALELLAPGSDLHFLGLPDGQLSLHRTELASRLAPLARAATHIVSPWKSDRHPDHEVCADIAARTANSIGAVHWQYPIWAWHWDDPASPAMPSAALRRFDLSERDIASKQAALECHRSQHTALSAAAGDETILPPRIVEHFLREFETFIVDGSSPEYFDGLYAGADDPWDARTRFYESRKRELVLAALPRRSFRRAFEPGCSIGLLTELLAPRCEQLVAWDVSARALELAAHRTARFPGVVLECRQIPDLWPAGELDLLVLSEVGYYAPDLDRLVDRATASLAEDGVVLACHWRHPAPDHRHTAEVVHAALGHRLTSMVTHVEQDFLLQVWSRRGRSVAQDEGIVS